MIRDFTENLIETMEIEKDLFYHYIYTCFCTCSPHSVILGAAGARIQVLLPDRITRWPLFLYLVHLGYLFPLKGHMGA